VRDTPDIRIEHERPGAAILVLEGDHDVSGTAQLSALVASLVETHELVVVDLSGAEFVDSSVISALVQAKRDSLERGRAFRVQIGTEDIVRRAFELVGVLEYLEWAPTREEALRGAGE
jgi:anti-sigma B factor antagonist